MIPCVSVVFRNGCELVNPDSTARLVSRRKFQQSTNVIINNGGPSARWVAPYGRSTWILTTGSNLSNSQMLSKANRSLTV